MPNRDELDMARGCEQDIITARSLMCGTDGWARPWLADDPAITGPAIEAWMRRLGSPLHLYSQAMLDALAKGFLRFAHSCGRPVQVAYAVKACPAPDVLALMRQHGLLAEVNSENEYRMALAAGFAPAHMHINGVAKSDSLIDLAVQRGCRALHLDSVEEIGRIASRARALGRAVAVHLRLCPDVATGRSRALMTGDRGSPFGIAETDLPLALARLREAASHLELRGLHMHVGSGGELDRVYPDLIDTVNRVVSGVLQSGVHSLHEINLGGGFVSEMSCPDRVAGADTLLREIQRLPGGLALAFEPGRFLVERASSLFCRVTALKRKVDTTWVFLDAGYCHLTDRAVCDASFPVQSLRALSAPPMHVRLAGPLCDGADVYLPAPTATGVDTRFSFPSASQPGDPVEIGGTGAYVYSTGNHFAGFTQPAVFLVERTGRLRCMRRAEHLADLTALERRG